MNWIEGEGDSIGPVLKRLSGIFKNFFYKKTLKLYKYKINTTEFYNEEHDFSYIK